MSDDYYTPKSAWDNIQHFIPKDKVIWEAFYGDGNSGDFLKELGFDVIHKNIDFFKNDLGDIIVSNPPFSKKKEIFKRLLELDKPFILILPISVITYNYYRNLDLQNKIQYIVPKSRIHFKKTGLNKSSCNFDCLYYCYKMNLPKDIIFL